MQNKESFQKFLYNGFFTDKTISNIKEVLVLNDKKLIRDSFKYLKDLITDYEDTEYFYNMIYNTTQFISILCDKQTFNEDEVIINRKRIKKMRESILALSSIYCNDILLDSANKLDEIILDKNINVDDLIILIKELIRKKEDINIIKKILNTNKGAIILNRNVLFDHTFELAMVSILDNNPDIYYYIALLKIFYSSTIDKSKYIKTLTELTDDTNEFANEIYLIIHGIKRTLDSNQILNKYGISRDLESKKIILPTSAKNDDILITIDTKNTKIRDDALSIKKDGNNYIVGIHIANPGRFINPNEKIDIDARNNYRCKYIKNNNLRILSNPLEKTFSLDKDNIKYSISLYVVLDNTGIIKDYKIVENEVKISENLDFEVSDSLIDARYKNELSNRLNLLFDLASILETNNKQKHDYWVKKQNDSLESDTIQYKSNTIVSELMVLYNHLMAVNACENNIPYIYRTKSISYINDLINKLNIELDDSTSKLIKNIYLPSRYSHIPLYHNGLHIQTYSHSASPIRRYPDLYNQYLYHMFYFKDKEEYFDYDEFINLIDYCNKRNTELSLLKGEYERALKLEKKVKHPF